MKKNLAFTAGLLLLTLLLTALGAPLAMLWMQRSLPAVYGESYYAALQDKYARLCASDLQSGRRILVIGGSGVAFTVDSALLEEETGIPCVNFGLYAAFGSEYMMELAREHLREGDVVLLCPELSTQTLSMYFGAEAALQASEGELSLLREAAPRDYPALFAAFPAYLQKKLQFLLPREASFPSPEGVYARASFDERGDLRYERPENRMPEGYQPDALPTLTPDAFSEDYLAYLEEYAAYAASVGATLYFAFPFMNRLSVEGTTEEEREALEDFLRERLSIPLLCPLEDRILDPGYFYDSNYHTNTVGTEAATLLLAQDIKRILGDSTPPSRPVPPCPAEDYTSAESESLREGFWLYRLQNGKAALEGLTDEGKALEVLRVPERLGGFPVTAVKAGAFRDCAAKRIVLPAGVTELEGALFEGCEQLEKLELLSQSLPAVGDTLLSGFAGKLTILVPSALYGDYLTDYFWARYGSFLAPSSNS